MDKFCLTPNFAAKARAKCEVNRGSQSEIIFLGSPNHWYTCSKYNCAIFGPVFMDTQGRKRAAREHL